MLVTMVLLIGESRKGYEENYKEGGMFCNMSSFFFFVCFLLTFLFIFLLTIWFVFC